MVPIRRGVCLGFDMQKVARKQLTKGEIDVFLRVFL